MGFSVSVSAAIIGVAVLMSFEFIVADVIPTITDTNDSYDEMRDKSIEQIQTNINITNAITPSNGSNYDLNITVKNTGSITLETSYFDILINGTKHTFTCSENYFFPENIAYFNVTNLAGSGNRKLKIITNNGISDYYEYTI